MNSAPTREADKRFLNRESAATTSIIGAAPLPHLPNGGQTLAVARQARWPVSPALNEAHDWLSVADAPAPRTTPFPARRPG